MWKSLLLPLLLAAFGSRVDALKKGALTINIVSSQIDDYLESNPNPSRFGGRYTPGCALACAFLDHSQPGSVSYRDEPAYEFGESKYWSVQQASVLPTCRFSPTNSLGVSLAVLAARVTHCRFAVKSGGHAAFAGASNIDRGLTIDLVNLNQITVSADEKETAVGAGNLWLDVYSALQPKGLAVIGGRVSAIGVGGLTLGGGMSFFSGRYGWACDNVNTYEVVFADGSIKNVTRASHPDLYFALRGGGNNFGIVTRFDMVTFPQGDLWAGFDTYLYSDETSASFIDAMYWLNINSPSDPYAQVILAYVYAPSVGGYAMAPSLQYGKPVEKPPILQNFTSIPGAVASTLRITNLPDLTVEFNASNPGGFRQTYWTLTTKNSATLMTQMTAIWMEEIDRVKDATDILPALVLQALPTNLLSHFGKNGGNALGVTAADGPLILVNLAISWSSAADDTRIFAAARNTITRVKRTAHAQGLDHPFLYQNYAALEQAVFPSYGEGNLERLRKASRKYDPEGVWQRLQPGYFKLF